jgi:hypothetical protein
LRREGACPAGGGHDHERRRSYHVFTISMQKYASSSLMTSDEIASGIDH